MPPITCSINKAWRAAPTRSTDKGPGQARTGVCLTSCLHPLRQVREAFCRRPCRTASTASDLFSYESRLLHRDTASSCGGLNTPGSRVNSGATRGGIQPTCTPSISNLRQSGRQDPAGNTIKAVTLGPLTTPCYCHTRPITCQIKVIHSAEELQYLFRPGRMGHF